jgi:hypothetical protein
LGRPRLVLHDDHSVRRSAGSFCATTEAARTPAKPAALAITTGKCAPEPGGGDLNITGAPQPWPPGTTRPGTPTPFGGLPHRSLPLTKITNPRNNDK